MTLTESEKLRKDWAKYNLPPCPHKLLSLEETSGGYLPENYVCNRCGAVVFKQNLGDPILLQVVQFSFGVFEFPFDFNHFELPPHYRLCEDEIVRLRREVAKLKGQDRR